MDSNIRVIRELCVDPTDALTNKLNAFNSTIDKTFGSEIAYIEHHLWDDKLSFTFVKFENGDHIGFVVTEKMVLDDTYEASHKHLRKAFSAFGLEMPYWARI